MKNKIPDNFLWGASTSAMQFEGAINSDGKGKTVIDAKEYMSRIPKGLANFEHATDHYNHWEEDVDLMAEMGFKSYRFSIAWSRIFPKGDGEINPKGLEFYKKLITRLKQKNIEPIVTIFHFDLPLSLHERGGWANREVTVPAYVNYAKLLFETFADQVKYWITINEQNIMVLYGHAIGTNTSKEKKSLGEKIYQECHNMNIAQSLAVKECKKIVKNCKIGPAPNISLVYADSSNPEDVLAASNANIMRNWFFLDALAWGKYNKIAMNFFEEQGYDLKILPGDMEILKENPINFIAFNYYTTAMVKASSSADKFMAEDQQTRLIIPGLFKGMRNNNLPSTEFGWDIDPIGFRTTCRELYQRYGLPIMITENGLGAKDVLTDDKKVHDDYRINYLKAHIEQIPLIINDGIELIGFNPWSAIDIVSTHQGISKRYGFVYVNRDEVDLKDMKRYKKDSFYWYQNVIKSNGTKL